MCKRWRAFKKKKGKRPPPRKGCKEKTKVQQAPCNDRDSWVCVCVRGGVRMASVCVAAPAPQTGKRKNHPAAPRVDQEGSRRVRPRLPSRATRTRTAWKTVQPVAVATPSPPTEGRAGVTADNNDVLSVIFFFFFGTARHSVSRKECKLWCVCVCVCARRARVCVQGRRVGPRHRSTHSTAR